MNHKIESISKSDRIINFIVDSIRNGDFEPGRAVPSINVISQKFGVARKTAVRAYEKLKSRGYIESRPQKGFYVINKKPNDKLKVLLIVHSFEGQWQTLYNGFRDQVIDVCAIDIYFHHYNIKLLELIVTRNVDDYDLFVISSFNHPRIKSVIGRIPSYKVLIISRNDRLGDSYNSVVQDFYSGTYHALVSAHDKVKSYKKINLSFPEKGGHPDTLKKGFLKYCHEYDVSSNVVNTLADLEIRKGEAFLIISDNDLIHLLNVCKERNWQLGKDVGVISYNETPLKQVIRDGISVISCNFSLMADSMAGFIKDQKSLQEIIPINFTERNSL